jgi:hypothetical protein
MSRLSQLNRQNLNYLGRMALIIVLAAVAEGLVVEFVSKPFPFTAMIPCLIPILISVFVIIPLTQSQKMLLRTPRAKA